MATPDIEISRWRQKLDVVQEHGQKWRVRGEGVHAKLSDQERWLEDCRHVKAREEARLIDLNAQFKALADEVHTERTLKTDNPDATPAPLPPCESDTITSIDRPGSSQAEEHNLTVASLHSRPSRAGASFSRASTVSVSPDGTACHRPSVLSVKAERKRRDRTVEALQRLFNPPRAPTPAAAVTGKSRVGVLPALLVVPAGLEARSLRAAGAAAGGQPQVGDRHSRPLSKGGAALKPAWLSQGHFDAVAALRGAREQAEATLAGVDSRMRLLQSKRAGLHKLSRLTAYGTSRATAYTSRVQAVITKLNATALPPIVTADAARS
ncbi:hypothetical protein DIPPA_07614 [Diplonema papillatum]|nr:hypothetical protein DIPPA_07614 [Diplonema papillatum]